MQLHRPTILNKAAKKLASPLSFVAGSKWLRTPFRVVDAYLNFLVGKGSGTGWDLSLEVNSALSRVYSESPVLFDIGANLGLWSKAVLEAVPRARLFLFEPSPGCQAEIRRQALPYEALIPAAVGRKPGRASLHFSSPIDGSASLYQRGDSYFRDRAYDSIEVEVVTIDSMIEQHRLEFIDFIKMDIEGNELEALLGAETALAGRRIGALAFEFGSSNINSRTFFRDFWSLLTARGFALSRITPSGRLLPITAYYEDCEYFRGATNYLAELKDHPRRKAR
jgi:FkbM family methyltransferase